MREVQLVEDGLGHNAYASPKVAQGVLEILDPDGSCNYGAPRILLLRKTAEYSSATLFHQLDNLRGRWWSFVVDDVLDVLGVGRYMQDHH